MCGVSLDCGRCNVVLWLVIYCVLLCWCVVVLIISGISSVGMFVVYSLFIVIVLVW